MFFFRSALSQVCGLSKDYKYPVIDSACGSENECKRPKPIAAVPRTAVFIPAVKQQIKIQVDVVTHGAVVLFPHDKIKNPVE